METLHPIFTIGHAMHPVAQFIDPLGAHGVTLVADVHTIPRSRYHPESNRDMLPEALAVAAIAYLRLPGIT